MKATLSKEEIFPTLTADQIGRLEPLGKTRCLDDGGVLFAHGAENLPFYVILDGAVAIAIPTFLGEHVVAVQGAGEFVGDIETLAGRRAMVSGRAQGSAKILEIDRAVLHRIVQIDVELGEILLRAFILRRTALLARGQSDLVVVGTPDSAATLRLVEFLTRNGRPYSYLDLDREPGVQALLDNFQVRVDEVPVVLLGGGAILRRPTIEELADRLGLSRLDQDRIHDLVVVGAGPAGLAAAVYGASEGLDVVVVEAQAPGGQAGTSSKIENYLGFPTGISGLELAERAFAQAAKFGAAFSVARTATALDCDRRPYRLGLCGNASLEARAVVIASGVRYRKPDIKNLERFEGAGVYFAATELEAKLCQREEVVIVGGGNSAGQAAVFLSRRVAKVWMVVRGPSLADTMSRYLIRRIEETPSLTVLTRTEIEAMEGESRLERAICVERTTGARLTLHVRHAFIMTGADPLTGWLKGCVALDEKGFVKTDIALDGETLQAARWPLARLPYPFETTLPGVFAVGDVRANSIKRVAAAVGEGSACVLLVHRVLAE